MNNILRITTVLAASSALCGCAVMDSIHWKFPGPNGSEVFTVDAKQRHLILAKDGDNKIRVCAEAAPDAFSAFSSSLSGSFGGGNKAEAANAFAETAATIERTQTVNLLRENMYRTCERWLSGALTQEQFLTLAARDHRSMVAVLAIEQLTGVVKPQSTVISGPAVSASLRQSAELIKLVDRYGKERASADEAANAAAAALLAANKDYTVDGKTVKVCTLGEAPGDATAAANWSACKNAETKDKAAKQAAADAKERELLVLKQLDDLSGGLAAATSAGTIASPGFTPRQLTPAELKDVSEAVTKIVLTPGIDEAMMFCVGYLNRTAFQGDDTRTTCNRVVAASATQGIRVRGELLELGASPADIQASETRTSKFDEFKIGVLALIDRTPTEHWAEFWNPFAKNLTVQGPDCTTRESCQREWAFSAPYYDDYFNRPEVLRTAGRNWEKQLQAIGR